MPAECWSNGRLLMATSLRLQGTKYRQYGDSYKKERILSYLKISQKPTIKSKPYNKEKILSCLKISQNPTLSTQGGSRAHPKEHEHRKLNCTYGLFIIEWFRRSMKLIWDVFTKIKLKIDITSCHFSLLLLTDWLTDFCFLCEYKHVCPNHLLMNPIFY